MQLYEIARVYIGTVTEEQVTVSFECLYISTERRYSDEYVQIIVDRCESCGQDHLIRGE